MHQIKGAAANVGGKALSAIALEMELAGKAGNIDIIQTNIDQLERRFNDLKLAMEQEI
jgi:HPt (histidine-containing phosphotransfer) domain-containing protein